LVQEGMTASSLSGRQDVYDDDLERSVCRAQEAFGVPQTGIADEATLKVLGAEPEERIRRLRALALETPGRILVRGAPPARRPQHG
jgi:murein L,D-transpeptidase YcbB/YkuD